MALTGLTNLQPNNIKVTGIATFDQTVGIAGTLTYEDVTNIDAVGLITARSGVSVSGGQVSVGAGTSLHSTGLDLGTGNITGHNLHSTGIITATSFVGSGANLTGISQVGGSTGVDFNDNVKIRLGTGNDLEIFHDGSTASIIKTKTGDQLSLQSDLFWVRNSANSESIIKGIADGAVELYFDNTKRIETTTHGASITGKLDLSSDLDMGDNDFIKLGDGDDLTISHDATNSTIHNQTGNLRVRNAGEFQVTKSSTENMLIAKPDGAVELYFNNSKNLETTSTGVSVTGVQAINGGLTDTPFTIDATATNGPHMRFKKNGTDLHFVGCAPGIGAGGDSEDMAIRFKDQLFFNRNGTNFAKIDNTAFYPNSTNTYDLGASSKRWRNIYTNDLNLSNEGSSNDVDGTWGNYTIQEGESDLFLINKRNGKKYKFNLTEVS